jgi:VanZ family protein
MADHDQKVAASLLCVITFLIVLGSLYPFSFAASGAGPFELTRVLSFAGTTRSDVAANVLLYLPLGACVAWLVAARHGGIAAIAVAMAAGAALSFTIEFAQLYETRRVASLADFASNLMGSLAGAWIAIAIRRTQGERERSPFAGFLRHPVAGALLLSWIGYRLAPFAPALDPGKWTQAFEPLAAGGWLAPGRLLPHLLAWLILSMLATRLAPSHALRLIVLSIVVVLAGRVLFAGTQLEPAELAGMAVALALTAPLARLPPSQAAWLLAAALVLLIAIEGLAPFDFQLAQDRFALVPFGESLTQYRATNLSDMFLRCFTNGALVWLLARTGLSVLGATGLGAGVVFAIELLQTWLPGQTAEITDPLLAVAAGGLIAVFEPDGDRVPAPA